MRGAAAIAGLGFMLCAPAGPASAREVAEPPLVIAHRGASGHQPEHTFAAYDLALEMHADYLEQDLQLTQDGVLVVLHDETLDRTARGPSAHCSGLVAQKQLASLLECDVGSWKHGQRADAAGARIPTLDAVLGRYAGRARFYIELKDPQNTTRMEDALVGLLRAHQLMPRQPNDWTVVVQSFDEATLRRLHAREPLLPLVQLFEPGEIPRPLDPTMLALKEYASGIAPNHRDVDGSLVLAAQRRGLVVHPWTVNERSEAQRLMELGVEGMFTDYPDRMPRNPVPEPLETTR